MASLADPIYPILTALEDQLRALKERYQPEVCAHCGRETWESVDIKNTVNGLEGACNRLKKAIPVLAALPNDSDSVNTD